MKQQNSKWYERYTVTPHPLGTMWTLWGIRGIVAEALGDYPTEDEAMEVMEKLKAEDGQGAVFPRLRAVEDDMEWNVYLDETPYLIANIVDGTGDGSCEPCQRRDYAKLFAAAPKLLAFAEAYLEAVSDPTGDVEELARMAERARAAVDEARGRV